MDRAQGSGVVWILPSWSLVDLERTQTSSMAPRVDHEPSSSMALDESTSWKPLSSHDDPDVDEGGNGNNAEDDAEQQAKAREFRSRLMAISAIALRPLTRPSRREVRVRHTDSMSCVRLQRVIPRQCDMVDGAVHAAGTAPHVPQTGGRNNCTAVMCRFVMVLLVLCTCVASQDLGTPEQLVLPQIDEAKKYLQKFFEVND